MLFLFVFLLVLLVLFFMNTNENFTTYYGHQCNSCKDLNMGQCMKCDDCGVCYTDGGKANCVRGDQYGPYDNVNNICQRWYHNDPFSRYVNENRFCVQKPFNV